MKFIDKIYMENYYLNNPVKFFTNPRKIRDFFFGSIELLKILLAKLHLLKWTFNERLLERPFVFQNLPKSGKVLDIGCGDSIMPIEMASLGYEVYGNDIRKYPFKYKNFKFIFQDALKLNFENYFDAITCISVIEHVGLSRDYQGKTEQRKDKLMMEKMNRMLKSGGILILTTMFGTKRILENQHTRIYDSKEVRWLSSGFKILKERYFYLKAGVYEEASPEFIEKLTEKEAKDTVVLLVLKKVKT